MEFKLADVPTQVLVVLLLVGGAGSFLLHPVAFQSEHKLSTTAYNFVCTWSFFIGNLLFLLRLLAQELSPDYVQVLDEKHIILFAQSIYVIGSFGALAAFYSDDDSVTTDSTEAVAALKKTVVRKKTLTKRKRSSSRRKRE